MNGVFPGRQRVFGFDFRITSCSRQVVIIVQLRTSIVRGNEKYEPILSDSVDVTLIGKRDRLTNVHCVLPPNY